MPKTTQVCEELPPLPVGSIDVDTMIAAIKAGKTGEEAIAAALHVPAIADPEPTPEPAPEPAPVPVSDADPGA